MSRRGCRSRGRPHSRSASRTRPALCPAGSACSTRRRSYGRWCRTRGMPPSRATPRMWLWPSRTVDPNRCGNPERAVAADYSTGEPPVAATYGPAPGRADRDQRASLVAPSPCGIGGGLPGLLLGSPRSRLAADRHRCHSATNCASPSSSPPGVPAPDYGASVARDPAWSRPRVQRQGDGKSACEILAQHRHEDGWRRCCMKICGWGAGGLCVSNSQFSRCIQD